jgi:hypothetical protein
MNSIAIGRWPQDAGRRAEFAQRKVPCLWLIEPTTEPPIVGPWEDWIRLPASESEIAERLRTLVERACRPELVDRVMLRNSLGTAALSANEAAVVEQLLKGNREVVSRSVLEALVWPAGAPTKRSLDDLIYRLRQRLRPLRLTVFGSRTQGYLIGVELGLTDSFVRVGE